MHYCATFRCTNTSHPTETNVYLTVSSTPNKFAGNVNAVDVAVARVSPPFSARFRMQPPGHDP